MKTRHNFEEITKKGGEATKQKYGREHYVKAGQKGATTNKKKDPEYWSKLSLAGVEARKKKQIEREKKEREAQKPLNRISKLLSGN